MAYAMTKQGSLDNYVTYEFICDAVEDMNAIEDRYRTIGTVAIVLSGESGLEVYIAGSDKQWNSLSSIGANSGSGESETIVIDGGGFSIHICSSSEIRFGKPNISEPDSKTIYLVPASDSSSGNLYDEYIYVNNKWEKFGSGGNIDLSGYAPKADPIFTGSISLGRKENTTIGIGSFAFGGDVEASEQYSHAEGYETIASDHCSHAEGNEAIASGVGSHAEGNQTIASGYFSHAEGDQTKAYNWASHAEGDGNSVLTQSVNGIAYTGTGAYGVASHAEGKETFAIGQNSHAEGYGTVAASDNQHVAGKYNINDENNQYAEIIGNGSGNLGRSNLRALEWNGNEYLNGDLYVGCNTDSTGGTKVATINQIPDTNLFAMKANPEFTGSISFGRGENTTIGENSVAIGYSVTASGFTSYAEGRSTVASGGYSHAEGYETIAGATGAHTEGYGTKATGGYSHVSGIYNIVDSQDNWSEWQPHTFYPRHSHIKRTINDSTSYYIAKYDHNSGDTFTEGEYSSIWENYNSIRPYSQTSIYAEIIGNGLDGASSRSNARALDWIGNEYLMGNLYVNCNENSTDGEKVLTHKDLFINKKIDSYIYINLGTMDIRNSHLNIIQELPITKEQLTYGQFFLDIDGQQQLIDGKIYLDENNNNNWEFITRQCGIRTISRNSILRIQYNESSNQYTIKFSGFYDQYAQSGANASVQLIFPVYNLVSPAKDFYINTSADFTGGEKVATETYVDTKVPEAPSADGTYILQATVTNGTPTYSWVSLSSLSGVTF